MNTTRSGASHIRRALAGAALFLATSATLTWLSPEYINPELAARLMGILIGLPVVVYANAAPKALTPLSRLRCNPAMEQAIRRFSGWSLTLGGVAFMLSWATLPLAWAGTVATSLLAVALLLVVVRCTWRPARHPSV